MRKIIFSKLPNRLKRAMIIIALFSIYSFCYGNEPQILNKINKNCIWVDYSSITDSTRSDSLIAFISKNNINTVFLETYNNGAIVNEEFINKIKKTDINDTLNQNNSIFNPLKYFLDKSTLLESFKVYAWMDIYKLWTKNYYPEDSTHFYYQCPECLENDINGKSDRLIKLDKIQSLEWEGVFLSPMHPEVNTYIINRILYILDTYDFDGVILDQMKYQAYYYGYNSIGMEIFHDKHNIDPLDINRGLISEYYGYKKSEADSIKSLWNNFRINGITNLIEEINQAVDTEIIVKVEKSPEESKNRWYQDWNNWLLNNLVDFLVIKNHTLDFKEFNYYNKLIDRTYNRSKNFNKIIIDVNALNGTTSYYTANKILSLRLHKFNNISIYGYDEYKHSINWYSPIYNTVNFNINNE